MKNPSIPDALRGYVRIRITGGSYDRFLNLCAHHGIRLWRLLPRGVSYEACVTNRDFRRLKGLVRKSHVKIRITERHGLPFFLHRYRKRKIYAAGILAAALFMTWLSSHIWKITIDGNLSQTDDIIFEYLEQEGICHGMAKAGVDCKALASQIRNYFTQFSWVAVELKGTRLQIHVTEGILSDPAEADAALTPSSLAASEDGVVVSIYARKGLPQVEAGETVEKGQVLVTGALPVYNDGGEVSSYQYVAADADIIIQNQLSYRDEIPRAGQQKRYTGKEKREYLLEVGDVPFALPVSFDGLSRYDVTGNTRQLRLMENFYLPLYFKVFTAREYDLADITYTDQELESLLTSNLQYFIKKLEEKGVQIFENDVKIELTEKSAIASGAMTVGKEAVRRVALSANEEELPENEYG